MIIEEAKKVIKIEAEGVAALVDRIDHRFKKMVKMIYRSYGRLIVSGLGKSGIVGRKIVATLNSTGTPAIFLHPVEAMHGDLGQVSKDDICLAVSNSGETSELNNLVASIRDMGCSVVAFTGDMHSTLARLSDIAINVGVEREACPLGVAPTASTTAQLAMGDALAVVLINKRHFKLSDFKRIHPGGKLGRLLSNKIGDIMLTKEAIPLVLEGVPIMDAIAVMDRFELGHAVVTKPDHTLRGIITDGDIRRMLVKKKNISTATVNDIMTANPRALGFDCRAYDALNMMERYQITAIPVVDSNRKVQGILHIHDLLGKGNLKFNGS